MNKLFSAPLAVIAASLCLSVVAADNEKAATAPALARTEAKNLKTHSEADYKARRKIAEANEVLNKADCRTALEGRARRACERSAKAAARSHKTNAKTVHEIEEKAIRDARK